MNIRTVVLETFFIIYLFCVSANGVMLISPSPNTNKIPQVKEERVDIIYDSTDLKEINHDGILKLQVIGNPSMVPVTCEYTGNVTDKSFAFVDWYYDGLHEDIFRPHQNTAYVNMSTGSPIARMECMLQNKSLTSSSTNATLIYRGDDKAPYLYNHGNTVSVKIFNKSIALLPCVLKYPIENNGHAIKIQLLKDGEEIDEKYWRYLPEQGYHLNLNELEDPYGEYNCKVVGSTADDFLNIEFLQDDIIRSEVTVTKPNNNENFYVGDPNLRSFQCKVPKSRFLNKFNWYYLYSDGKYESIQTEINTSDTPSYYTDTVRINFPSTNITHVVCVGYLNETGHTSHNNSVAVKVKEPLRPVITSRPLKQVIYENGSSLTCDFQGDPINTPEWKKNGEQLGQGYNLHYQLSGLNKSSRLVLNPPAFNEVESIYTCTVRNFLGSENCTFKVKLPETDEGPLLPPTSPTLAILGGVLGAAIIIIVVILAVFKVHLKRRRFDPEKIRLFFNGTGSEERQNNDYSNDFDQQVPEPIDSVPYDASHEISPQLLHFVKELKRGNFGKVDMGRVTDKKTGKRTIVAIKSIINDKPDVSPEELDYEFDNFLKEIKRSQILGIHPNVVGYIGAVTVDLSQYSAYLVVEYCAGGDIRSLMSRCSTFYDEILDERHDFPCTQRNNETSRVVLRTSHLMRWAEEAACGMEYIHSKGLLHRDIAIRNILLAIHPDHDHDQEYDCLDPSILVAKISDFGLSKDLHELPKDYYRIIINADPQQNRPHPLPLRWLALESLETLRFTRESDVWTFGVALWEMFTLGCIPYENEISRNYGGDLRLELITHLRNSENILPEPEYVPIQIWEIMKSCWNTSPGQRPSFKELKQRIHEVNMEFEGGADVTDSDSEGQQDLHYPDVIITTKTNNMEGYSSISAVQNGAYDPEGDSESCGHGDDGDSDENDSAWINESYEDDEVNNDDYLSVVTVSKITYEGGDDILEDRDSNYNKEIHMTSHRYV